MLSSPQAGCLACKRNQPSKDQTVGPPNRARQVGRQPCRCTMTPLPRRQGGEGQLILPSPACEGKGRGALPPPSFFPTATPPYSSQNPPTLLPKITSRY